ncbi:hypothetical protein E2562_023548 [Oryza meyeriana var. granulata]|uniref:SIAH-type domain-containing protein n=1 Tax=Oryza meyeriana var. granulata TaxID=110450 RepID=A0A6G1E0S0_9ORYZ|nr:hypothetical protein E2562_023548 [Oryza meyeriana var. granulata]
METTSNGTARQRSSVATNATIDLEALDCTICYDPHKPRLPADSPLMQCGVGHVICSSCHGKLVDRSRCHLCNMDAGYNRCMAVEHILQSILVPCPNAAYGCAAKTAYHDGEGHSERCPHAPCFCPEPDCGFAGGTASLLAHLTARHGWPVTEIRRSRVFDLQLQEGKRLHLHDADGGGHLFLLTVAPAGAAGLVCTVLLVEPHGGGAKRAPPRFECHVAFSCGATGWRQSSEFAVTSTSLSDGLPVDCYAFVVPKVGQPPVTASVVIYVFGISRGRPRSGDLRLRLN